MKKPPTEADALARAIKSLHGCESMWLRSIPVVESHDGKVVWEGTVEVFWLQNHPTAQLCYAWSHAIDKSTKHRYVVVLHQPPVYSAQAAVRAVIVQEYREKKSP
jgi:hypothetical protein